jgi:hypothetical protein
MLQGMQPLEESKKNGRLGGGCRQKAVDGGYAN